MDWEIYVRSVLALLAVLFLIAGAAWMARRLGYGAGAMVGRRKRRLSIVEVLPLDNRRRLVLVRKDEVEHLLMIGGGADVVVESGAMPAAGGAPADEKDGER